MQQSDTLPQTRTPHIKDHTGQIFGNLRVVGRAGNYRNNGSAECTWTVQCVRCERIHPKPVRGSFLRGGKVTGKKCPGCRPKPERADVPFRTIDETFIRQWTPLIYASIGKVIGFGQTFQENHADLLQDILLNLSQLKNDVPNAAMSSLIWRIAKYRTINFINRSVNKYDRTLKASADADGEGSYEFILDSLTYEPEGRTFTPEETAFDELSEDEKQFCREYLADTRFKSAADRAKITEIRERLMQRVKELESGESNLLQEVHAN
jgi:hypothetical protein